MKSQSLSISTIVLIIIAVVVLAAVLMFFFRSMGGTQGSMNSQVDTAKCNTIVSQIAGQNPKDPSEVEQLADSKGYCSAGCGKVLRPKIQTQSGVCTLTCNGNSAQCS